MNHSSGERESSYYMSRYPEMSKGKSLAVWNTYWVDGRSLSNTGDWPGSISFISTRIMTFCAERDLVPSYKSTALSDEPCAGVVDH